MAFERLTTEINRIVAAPYPVSLKVCNALLCGVDTCLLRTRVNKTSSLNRSLTRDFRACTISSLARTVLRMSFEPGQSPSHVRLRPFLAPSSKRCDNGLMQQSCWRHSVCLLLLWSLVVYSILPWNIILAFMELPCLSFLRAYSNIGKLKHQLKHFAMMYCMHIQQP